MSFYFSTADMQLVSSDRIEGLEPIDFSNNGTTIIGKSAAHGLIDRRILRKHIIFTHLCDDDDVMMADLY